ncbi:Nn.00g056340.m01.CDS01 [Neocucurbitaria sp. VM-36]
MKTATLVAATALASTSYAATVTLETTKCLNANIPLEQFDIEIGTSKPVAKDLPAVCGLRILSASASTDVTTIQCQAFRDADGTQPGSAVFTFDSPALIGTNPIQEKSILCTIPSSPDAVVLDRRQEENSTTSSGPLASITGSRSAQSTVLITSTAAAPENSAEANSTSSAAPSTIVSTIVVSASSGLPTSSSNATTPSNTGRPSATQSSSNPAESTGAAGALSIGAGVVVAALAAWLL